MGYVREESVGLRAGELVAGRYRIERELGRGGMGVVWAATCEATGERVAIKTLSPRDDARPDARRRLLREARAATAVEHPNLVRVLDVVSGPEGVPAIVMEQLEGETLAARLARDGVLDLGETARLLVPVALALRAVHELGVVHRDIKPANLFLVRDASGTTRVKVLDFGLAKLVTSHGSLMSGDTLTLSGVLVGTPHYMAPEQVLGERDIDRRADIWSLGVVLYECLAGTRPAEGDDLGHVLRRVVAGVFRPLAEAAPDAPPDVTALVDAMLASHSSARLDDLGVVIDVLTRYAAAPPEPFSPALRRGQTRRRRLTWVFGSVSLALAGSLGVVRGFYRPANETPLAKLSGMAWLAGGTFTMGSSSDEIEAECAALGPACRHELFEREQPRRQVTLSPFYLDTHEVTNDDFAGWLNIDPNRLVVEVDPDHDVRRYVRDAHGTLLIDLMCDRLGVRLAPASPALSPRFEVIEGFSRKPVVNISWDAARDFCDARGKRLPTEAEWEYAGRGTEARRYPWGNDEPRCDGVVFGRNETGRCKGLPAETGEVEGALQDRTRDGVYGLGGNASEWVFDAFTNAFYPSCGACTNPRVDGDVGGTPARDEMRIVRGASWASTVFMRAAARARWKRFEVADSVGFRCAIGADSSTKRKQP